MENQNKPKLLYVAEPLATGVLTYLQELTNELINQYDIFIAYGIRPETPKRIDECFDPRVKLIKVPHFTRQLKADYDLKAFKELKDIISQVRPNIIHLNSSKAGALGRFAINSKKCPVFYTPHGYSFLMRSESESKARLYYLFEKICSKRAVTIACSEEEYNEALNLGGESKYVDNGIDTDSIDALLKDVKKESHPFTVFTSGRVSDQKNPSVFNEIATSFPNIRFVWIGKGDRENILTSKNITVTGWIDRRRALQIADQCDAFLLPSLWEGLSISLLEAMYLKKPVIVSDISGNTQVIKNRCNGFVCHTKKDYVEAINLILRYDSAVNEYVKHAYHDIITHYNAHSMAEQYDAIYQEALKAYHYE